MYILKRSLRDRRAALSWWLVGLIVYSGFIIAVWPVIDGNDEFADLYADMPEGLQAMFGGDGFADFTSPVGFLNTYLFSMILPFILTGLAVSMGASLVAGEEEDGLLDLVLSYPIQRWRLLTEKVAALVLALVFVCSVTVIFLLVAREPVDLDIGAAGLWAAILGSGMFALLHGLISVATGALSGSKSAATGFGWGVALVGYLFNVLASLDSSLDALKWMSPLYWATADSPLGGQMPGTYLLLAGVVATVAAVSLLIFQRHDLT